VLVVFHGVDINRRLALDRDLGHPLRVSRDQGSGALISLQLLHFRPNPPNEKNRMPRDTTAVRTGVHRPSDSWLRTQILPRHSIDELTGDLGLIAEQDRRRTCFRTCRAQASPQRCALALCVVGGDHNANHAARRKSENLPDLLGAVPEDNDDLIEAGSSRRVDDVLEQAAVAERQQLLRPAHACGRAGREDDAGKERSRFRRRHEWRPSSRAGRGHRAGGGRQPSRRRSPARFPRGCGRRCPSRWARECG